LPPGLVVETDCATTPSTDAYAGFNMKLGSARLAIATSAAKNMIDFAMPIIFTDDASARFQHYMREGQKPCRWWGFVSMNHVCLLSLNWSCPSGQASDAISHFMPAN
jgi:hypothetical protein